MRIRYPLLFLVAALALVSGCSEPAEPAAPIIDYEALDSGNYPTTPRDLSALDDPKYGPLREAIRIGATVPLVFETDPRFTFQRLTGPQRRVIPGVAPAVYGMEEAEFNELTTGLVAGWWTSAERRANYFLGRSVTADALRFGDAAAAEAAGARLADRVVRNVASGETVTIPNFPAARAYFSPAKRYLDIWMPHQSMLLYVHVDDPVSEPLIADPLVEIAQRVFAAVIDGLRNYDPTPVDRIAALPADVDGMLARTLPPAKIAEAKSDTRSMLLPSRAALHYANSPATTKSAYDDAGVDLVAASDAEVYRARDADGAARLLAALATELSDDGKAAPAPAGMPNARCFESKDDKRATRITPTCLLTYERFVARVTGANTQELHQKAAAQYKLLAAR